MSPYSTPFRPTTEWYRKVEIELLAGTSVVHAWVISHKYCCATPISITDLWENKMSVIVMGKPIEAVKSGKRASNIDGRMS